MTDEQKIKTINEILAEMKGVWDKSHRFLTQDEFNKLLQIYESAPDKEYANRIWEINGLPRDFKFNNRISITDEIFTFLHPEFVKQGIPHLEIHFCLSADDIINLKIPGRVCTCSGAAKLFCYFAKLHNLLCYVVQTVDIVNARKNPTRKFFNGHQIIAVEIDGKLVAFEPSGIFHPLADKTEIKVGNWLQSVEEDGRNKYLITRIATPDEFAQVKEYKDVYNPELIQNALRISQRNELESGQGMLDAKIQEANKTNAQKIARHRSDNENE